MADGSDIGASPTLFEPGSVWWLAAAPGAAVLSPLARRALAGADIAVLAHRAGAAWPAALPATCVAERQPAGDSAAPLRRALELARAGWRVVLLTLEESGNGRDGVRLARITDRRGGRVPGSGHTPAAAHPLAFSMSGVAG